MLELQPECASLWVSLSSSMTLGFLGPRHLAVLVVRVVEALVSEGVAVASKGVWLAERQLPLLREWLLKETELEPDKRKKSDKVSAVSLEDSYRGTG